MEPRLMSYLYFFNVKQDYYECHEVGEALWLDEGRPVILKGLIQAAVCLYHLHNGNVRGAWRMWQRSKQYMADSRPVYESIDLDQLVWQIDDVFTQVPSHLYDKVVSATQVPTWNLPEVRIKVTDPAIESAVETWDPEEHGAD